MYLFVEQHGDQSLEHAEVGLVPEHPLGGPVEPYVFVVFLHVSFLLYSLVIKKDAILRSGHISYRFSMTLLVYFRFPMNSVTVLLRLFPFLPFSGTGFPVGHLARLDGLPFAFGLVAFPVSCPLRLHVGNGGIVEHLDGTPPDGFLQVGLAEGFSRLVEVGDVELVDRAEVVAHQLLPGPVAGVFQPEQSCNLVDFILCELVSSHFICFCLSAACGLPVCEDSNIFAMLQVFTAEYAA